MIELQQEQPQLYQSLTTNLSQDEQHIVQGVVHQADALAAAAANAENQAATGVVGVVGGANGGLK